MSNGLISCDCKVCKRLAARRLDQLPAGNQKFREVLDQIQLQAAAAFVRRYSPADDHKDAVEWSTSVEFQDLWDGALHDESACTVICYALARSLSGSCTSASEGHSFVFNVTIRSSLEIAKNVLSLARRVLPQSILRATAQRNQDRQALQLESDLKHGSDRPAHVKQQLRVLRAFVRDNDGLGKLNRDGFFLKRFVCEPFLPQQPYNALTYAILSDGHGLQIVVYLRRMTDKVKSDAGRRASAQRKLRDDARDHVTQLLLHDRDQHSMWLLPLTFDEIEGIHALSDAGSHMLRALLGVTIIPEGRNLSMLPRDLDFQETFTKQDIPWSSDHDRHSFLHGALRVTRSSAEERDVNRCTDLVRQALRSKASPLCAAIHKMCKCGSLAKGTAVKGYSDLDLVLYWQPDQYDWNNQRQYCQLVRKQIEEVARNQGVTYKTGRVDMIGLKLWMHGFVRPVDIDLLVTAHVPMEQYLTIPTDSAPQHCYRASWSPDQVKFINQIISQSSLHGDFFIVAKYWIKILPWGALTPPKSYLIELICAHCIKLAPAGASVERLFALFLQVLQNMPQVDIRAPVIQCIAYNLITYDLHI